METNGNKKKREQLGMPYGTACNRLRKQILLHLLKRYGLDSCFRCGQKIVFVDELSIEHKKPWLDSDDPVKNFFDIENIAFSHLICNSGSGRRYKGPVAKHGTRQRYEKWGCRCLRCFAAKQRHNVLSKERGYK